MSIIRELSSSYVVIPCWFRRKRRDFQEESQFAHATPSFSRNNTRQAGRRVKLNPPSADRCFNRRGKVLFTVRRLLFVYPFSDNKKRGFTERTHSHLLTFLCWERPGSNLKRAQTHTHTHTHTYVAICSRFQRFMENK